jgi:hypothetical protein
VYDCDVAPLIAFPFKYHWFPVDELEVKTPPEYAIVAADGEDVTVIVNVFDVADDVVTQVELDVRIHVMVLPFVKALDVYVELLDPTFAPLTDH